MLPTNYRGSRNSTAARIASRGGGVSKPVLIDLFCCAGGAAKGYQRAGFYVIGVDIRPQPNYCGDEFYQADALTFSLSRADAIHASPPCQSHTRAKHLRSAQGGKPSAANLIPQTRERLQSYGGPWVMENVPGAPLNAPTIYCGSSFGLGVWRHRWFESRDLLLSPPCQHKGRPIGVYHRMGDEIPRGGRTAKTLEEGQAAMGIDWMKWDELKEAIPPAYTEHIGRQLMRAVEAGCERA